MQSGSLGFIHEIKRSLSELVRSAAPQRQVCEPGDAERQGEELVVAEVVSQNKDVGSCVRYAIYRDAISVTKVSE